MESIDEVAAESAMFRVLASIGTELTAFTHEINGLLEMTVALDRHLQRILNTAKLNRKDRAELQRAWSVRTRFAAELGASSSLSRRYNLG